MAVGTIFDLIVIGVILVSAGVAFFRGFIREVLTILGVIGGALAALVLGPSVIPFMHQWMDVQEGPDAEKLFDIVPYSIIADVAAYGGVFLLFVIVLHIISILLVGFVRSSGLGPVDRTLGVVFGLVRGILLVGIIYLPFSLVFSDQEKETYFEKSQSHGYVNAISHWMSGYLPGRDDDVAQDHGAVDAQDDDGVRTILKAIDVLDDEQKKKAIQTIIPSATNALKDGYDAQQREGLDSLIEKQTDPVSEKTSSDLNE